ncbi:molybdenum cofactor biosynthesis protein B [Mechercharimyces sp. CAU 1602]|uniref:MogA/MoaB family molybdenum cofactor biosynthesis protein n=1 Tax=Mechercharimyces sp. CAU 1602 TaxID=2973933 RepID=UPI002162157F|nr:molybdenum cofactor biosynthesis protein B [Mechercharimyces sp. CAU 1602]MCS1350090.1 molybdenum cofactor biosynthesis protein MoaB [Mechercharimyces sp. CAU 1602]
MSMHEHKTFSSTQSVGCKVIVVSDTRNRETDENGRLLMELLEKEEFSVVGYEIVKGNIRLVQEAIQSGCENPAIDVVLTKGGTGIARYDVTYEAVSGLLEKELVGFGELFRMISYEEIGSGAMMSRALAGTIGRKAVFSIPGSRNAINLAMKKLILPELKHIVWDLHRQ